MASLAAVLGTVLWAGVPPTAEAGWLEMRPVAVTGDAAPGAGEGAIFAAFNEVVIGSSGRLAFKAILAPGAGGRDGSSDVGVWTGQPSGPFALVAREGDPAPGTPCVFDPYFSSMSVNAQAQVVFHAYLRDDPDKPIEGTRECLYAVEPSGQATLLARQGLPAPGLPPETYFSGLFGMVADDDGHVAFTASVRPGDGGGTPAEIRGIWSGPPSCPVLTALEGSPAPGAPEGMTFGSFGPPSLAAGRVAFQGYLQTAGGELPPNREGIWLGPPGDLAPAVLAGNPAPGTPDGVAYKCFDEYVRIGLNRSGKLAFAAYLQGGVDDSNDSGLWAGPPGSLALLAREGDRAPGPPGGARFSALQSPLINGAGDVLFAGDLLRGQGGVDDSNDEGLWVARDRTLHLVAREGDRAPDAPVGAAFGHFSSLAMNESGQLAFRASCGGARMGIWAADAEGPPDLIACVGRPFEVAPGDVRTVAGAYLTGESGGQDGWPITLDDAGEIAFVLWFQDGTSGVFVATIPEPATVLLLALAAALVLRRRATRSTSGARRRAGRHARPMALSAAAGG